MKRNSEFRVTPREVAFRTRATHLITPYFLLFACRWISFVGRDRTASELIAQRSAQISRSSLFAEVPLLDVDRK